MIKVPFLKFKDSHSKTVDLGLILTLETDSTSGSEIKIGFGVKYIITGWYVLRGFNGKTIRKENGINTPYSGLPDLKLKLGDKREILFGKLLFLNKE